MVTARRVTGETRSDDAAAVLSAAQSLWPAPATTSVERRTPGASGDGAGLRYAVVPSLRGARFLVPPAPEVAVALRPAQLGLRGLRMMAVCMLQRRGVLHRLAGHHLRVLPAGEGIEEVLSSMVGPVAHLVVRLGRPRPNRTLVLWVFDDDGAPAAIAKLSRGAEAQEALETEYAVLAQAPADRVPGLVAPQAHGYVRWRDSDILLMTALVHAGAGPGHVPPVAQMRALAAAAGDGELPLRDTPFVARLAEEIGALASEADRDWLGRGLAALLDDHGATVVRTGAWHGDWVSWNQSRDGDDVLLWDWEHYATSALAGFDHVHFLAQEQRARGTGDRAEDAWVSGASDSLGDAWGFDADQRQAVLRGYLLEINLRFVRDRQLEPAAVARTGWAQGLVERLGLPQG